MSSRNSAPAIITIVAAFGFSACAPVPKSAHLLSQDIHEKIIMSRNSHLALLDVYETEKIHQIDMFMTTKWTPLFMQQFAETAKLDNEITSAKSAKERAEVVLEFQEAASARISERRSGLSDAVRKVTASMRARVNVHYDSLERSNVHLTNLLGSTVKAQETGQKALSILGVTSSDIVPFEEIEGIMNKITRFEGDVAEVTKLVDGARGLLQGAPQKNDK